MGILLHYAAHMCNHMVIMGVCFVHSLLLQHTQNEISTRPSPSGGRHNTRHGNKPHPPSNQHDPSHVYARGSLTSFKKLSKFFGEDPPRLEDMQSFLEALGYADLIQAS